RGGVGGALVGRGGPLLGPALGPGGGGSADEEELVDEFYVDRLVATFRRLEGDDERTARRAVHALAAGVSRLRRVADSVSPTVRASLLDGGRRRSGEWPPVGDGGGGGGGGGGGDSSSSSAGGGAVPPTPRSASADAAAVPAGASLDSPSGVRPPRAPAAARAAGRPVAPAPVPARGPRRLLAWEHTDVAAAFRQLLEVATKAYVAGGAGRVKLRAHLGTQAFWAAGGGEGGEPPAAVDVDPSTARSVLATPGAFVPFSVLHGVGLTSVGLPAAPSAPLATAASASPTATHGDGGEALLPPPPTVASAFSHHVPRPQWHLLRYSAKTRLRLTASEPRKEVLLLILRDALAGVTYHAKCSLVAPPPAAEGGGGRPPAGPAPGATAAGAGPPPDGATAGAPAGGGADGGALPPPPPTDLRLQLEALRYAPVGLAAVSLVSPTPQPSVRLELVRECHVGERPPRCLSAAAVAADVASRGRGRGAVPPLPASFLSGRSGGASAAAPAGGGDAPCAGEARVVAFLAACRWQTEGTWDTGPFGMTVDGSLRLRLAGELAGRAVRLKLSTVAGGVGPAHCEAALTLPDMTASGVHAASVADLLALHAVVTRMMAEVVQYRAP
ncbi:hypothetical protein BU14_0125s0038, partial [Porphyra umbilicalis]